MKGGHPNRRTDEDNPCPTCGNPLPPAAATCPFCERPVSFGGARKAAGPDIATVNLESGLPTVAEAKLRLEGAIDRAKANGTKLLRVIHGWGSSGQGGTLQREVRRHLAQLKTIRRVRSFLPGEEFGRHTVAGSDLIRRFSALRDSRADAGNPGITFVEP